jgi:hypothetical protein
MLLRYVKYFSSYFLIQTPQLNCSLSLSLSLFKSFNRHLRENWERMFAARNSAPTDEQYRKADEQVQEDDYLQEERDRQRFFELLRAEEEATVKEGYFARLLPLLLTCVSDSGTQRVTQTLSHHLLHFPSAMRRRFRLRTCGGHSRSRLLHEHLSLFGGY